MMAALTPEIVADGLSGVGRSRGASKHCLVELNVEGRGLASLDALAAYPRIQMLNVSGNSVTDLGPLASLTHLVDLDASGNVLTTVLEWETPQCTSKNAWADGEANVGSQLERADVSKNRILRMPKDLGQHRFLRELYLDHNLIKVASGLQNLKHLEVLSLTHNNLKSLRGLLGLPLKRLHIDGNRISSLEGLDRLRQLEVLTAGRNEVDSLDGCVNCSSLRQVDLSHNRVAQMRQCEHLRHLPLLQRLVLAGNPVCDEEHYRLRVLLRLQRVALLDGVDVSPEEKVKALNLHGRDVKNREQVFRGFMPDDEKFVNQLNAYVEPGVLRAREVRHYSENFVGSFMK